MFHARAGMDRISSPHVRCGDGPVQGFSTMSPDQRAMMGSVFPARAGMDRLMMCSLRVRGWTGAALAIYDAVSPLQVEERIVGDTRWLAIRARGAEWSYITTDEAANLGRNWIERFGKRPEPVQNTPLPELSRGDLKLIRIDGGPPPSSVGWKVI